MKLLDKEVPLTIGPRGGKHYTKVDVLEKTCIKKECYRPMPDKGSYVQGRGYVSYYENPEWVCGTRALHGCPD